MSPQSKYWGTCPPCPIGIDAPETADPLIGHGPGDVFSIRDEFLRLQSYVTNEDDVSGPMSE